MRFGISWHFSSGTDTASDLIQKGHSPGQIWILFFKILKRLNSRTLKKSKKTKKYLFVTHSVYKFYGAIDLNVTFHEFSGFFKKDLDLKHN